MTQIPNVNNSAAQDQASGSASAINELDLDSFLDLMIAELQNQDPLNPLDNDELIAQISQIREVGATEELTSTLNAVLLGQNITSATNLIGADVVALTDDGQRVSGNVQVVTIDDGTPRLDLRVDAALSAAAQTGEIEAGTYAYEVVWEGIDGDLFGFELDTRTDALPGFDGAIRLDNLPETTTGKKIYRTDRSGGGDRKLVAELPNGNVTTFVDTLADDNRADDTITEPVQALDFGTKVTVSLNNIGEIRPPRN